MSAPLTDKQIAQLAEDVNRAKMLHPGYRGPGDPIFDAADASVETGTITVVGPRVGRQIDVYHVTIAVRVPTDEAARLPGFPGATHEDEIDPPISGLDLLLGEAHAAASEAVERVLMASPLAADVTVGPGPNGGVEWVSWSRENTQDRLFQMRSGGNPITGAGALVGLMHHIHTTKPKTRSARHHVAWAVGPTVVVLVGAFIYAGAHP